MKSFLPKIIFTILTFTFSLNALAQTELELFLSGSLVFQDENGNVLKDAFSGGIESPRFFNLELNGDDKVDLVAFDRKNNKVTTYINNGSVGQALYRHSPAFEHLFPRGKNNYYILDIDRDGFKDIVCGDLYQNRLSFFKNKGLALPDLEFTNKGFISYTHFSPPSPGVKNNFGNPFRHIHALEDMDGDGDIDFLSMSSVGGNLEYYENRQVDSSLSRDSIDLYLSDICFGYFGEGIGNEVLLGQCTTRKFHTRRHAEGASMTLLDLDKDGDMDLLLGNSGFTNILMLTNGYSDYNAQYDSMIAWDSVFPRNTFQAKTDIFPSASVVDISGDGINDLVMHPTFNSDEEIKGTNQTYYYLNKGANDSFDLVYQGNNFLMNESIDLGANTSPCFYDYDKDGDQDLFIAHSGDRNITKGLRDQIALYKNIGDKDDPILKLITKDFGTFSSFNLVNSHLTIEDFDNDGSYEFFIGQGDGTVHRFSQSGSVDNPTFILEDNDFIGANALGGDAAVAFLDFDKDGDKDVLLGSFLGNINYYENTGSNTAPVFQWRKDKMGNMFTNVMSNRTNPPSLEGIGQSRPVVVDMNGDGVQEVISGSLTGKLFAWQPTNNINDTFEMYENFVKYLDAKNDTLNDYWFGRSVSVAAADLDNDSITDLIISNNAGGIHYLSGKARKFSVNVKRLPQLQTKIYPNPTQGITQITGLPTNIGVKVELMNSEGKSIQKFTPSFTTQKVDFTKKPSGVYIIRITANGYQSVTERVVKY